jgi:hypothetical protein
MEEKRCPVFDEEESFGSVDFPGAWCLNSAQPLPSHVGEGSGCAVMQRNYRLTQSFGMCCEPVVGYAATGSGYANTVVEQEDGPYIPISSFLYSIF